MARHELPALSGFRIENAGGFFGIVRPEEPADDGFQLRKITRFDQVGIGGPTLKILPEIFI